MCTIKYQFRCWIVYGTQRAYIQERYHTRSRVLPRSEVTRAELPMPKVTGHGRAQYLTRAWGYRGWTSSTFSLILGTLGVISSQQIPFHQITIDAKHPGCYYGGQWKTMTYDYWDTELVLAGSTIWRHTATWTKIAATLYANNLLHNLSLQNDKTDGLVPWVT